MILEQQVTSEMCDKKVKAMTNIVFTEEEYHCLNCNGLNKDCPDYKPIKNTGERFSYLNLYLR